MNLIDTIDRMAIQASRYRTTRLSAESRKRQADDDSEAIETVRAMQEALRPFANMAAHYPVKKTFGNRPYTGEIMAVHSPDIEEAAISVEDLWAAVEALRRAEGNAG